MRRWVPIAACATALAAVGVWRWRAVAMAGDGAPPTPAVVAPVDDPVADEAPATELPVVPAPLPGPSPVELAVVAGSTERLSLRDGDAWVWRPAGYHPDGAAAVIYVHGYYVDLDRAWREHQLAAQFASSSINAMFIAIAAPTGLREPVRFDDPAAILREVTRKTGWERPTGAVIAVGHSGAYRTVLPWLSSPLLDMVVLIDALYGDHPEVPRWLARGEHRRLVTIADDTLRWAEELARIVPGTVEVDRIPSFVEGCRSRRTAQHLLMRSQFLHHMPQVTGGVVIPLVLRLAPEEILADGPWQHPWARCRRCRPPRRRGGGARRRYRRRVYHGRPRRGRAVTWRGRAVRLALAGLLALLTWQLPAARRALIRAVVHASSPPGPPPALPGAAAWVPPAAAVHAPIRVVLVDGAGAETARAMPAWNALCARGLDLIVDVGFPTVSLPVQVSLWTGLTQQQTGVTAQDGRALAPPLAPPALPPQIAGSVAVAESHPGIVRSLGFARIETPEDGDVATPWQARAVREVGSDARLAFVHILRVDTAGHRSGRASSAYQQAAVEADALLGELVAARADAWWMVLADHGHLASGGHGGEERALRQVRACVAGPGVGTGVGGPIHLVDLSRTLADALGVRLGPAARGRTLAAALAAPLDGDDAVPSLPPWRALVALAIVALAVAATAWGMRGRLALGPWWFPVAIAALILLARSPTLSTTMIYRPQGRDLFLAYWPGLVVLAIAAGVAVRRLPPARAIAALLGMPLGAAAATAVACGAAPMLLGQEVAPVTPMWTAWTSPLLVIAASGCGVVAVALVVSALVPGFGPLRAAAAPLVVLALVPRVARAEPPPAPPPPAPLLLPSADGADGGELGVRWATSSTITGGEVVASGRLALGRTWWAGGAVGAAWADAPVDDSSIGNAIVIVGRRVAAAPWWPVPRLEVTLPTGAERGGGGDALRALAALRPTDDRSLSPGTLAATAAGTWWWRGRRRWAAADLGLTGRADGDHGRLPVRVVVGGAVRAFDRVDLGAELATTTFVLDPADGDDLVWALALGATARLGRLHVGASLRAPLDDDARARDVLTGALEVGWRP
ncbi:MAG: hypothetical protein R2939_11810 [Kofleriaceae bacterium]